MDGEKKLRYGIFTKEVHFEQIVNYLNMCTDVDYVISTRKDDLVSFDFDIGVSYCFPFIVDVEKDGRPWFNYHPGPLPEYPGLGNYADAIHDGVTEYGVTLHRMTMDVDRGEVLRKVMFNLVSPPSSVLELGNITHYYLFQLFKETIRGLPKWIKK